MKQVKLVHIENIYKRRVMIVITIIPAIIVGTLAASLAEGIDYAKEVINDVKEIWSE
jgi:hypothetical protein